MKNNLWIWILLLAAILYWYFNRRKLAAHVSTSIKYDIDNIPAVSINQFNAEELSSVNFGVTGTNGHMDFEE